MSARKKNDRRRRPSDRDTLRPEYDFSKGTRGATAKRYAEGSNVVVIDPDLLEVFPDEATVNETLRALAPVMRKRRAARKRRSA